MLYNLETELHGAVYVGKLLFTWQWLSHLLGSVTDLSPLRVLQPLQMSKTSPSCDVLLSDLVYVVFLWFNSDLLLLLQDFALDIAKAGRNLLKRGAPATQDKM